MRRKIKTSSVLRRTQRGTKGRRAARNLNDRAVARAMKMAKNKAHQMKFLSRAQRQRLETAEE